MRKRNFRTGAQAHLALLPFLTAASVLGAMVAVYAQQRAADGSDAPPRAVFTDKDVFLLADTEMIVGPRTVAVEPAPRGRWVLAVRQQQELPAEVLAPGGKPLPPPPGEISLVLWDGRMRRATTLWKNPLETGRIEHVGWLPGSDVALVVTQVIQRLPDGQTQSKRSLLLVDPASLATRPIATLSGGEALVVSPVQPLAALRSDVEGRSAFRLVGGNGTVGSARLAPEGAAFTGQWSEDGFYLFLWKFVPDPDAPKKFIRKWHALNVQTGTIRALGKAPTEFYKPRDALAERLMDLPVHLKQSTAILTEGETKLTLRPLWLSQSTPLAVGDAGTGENARALIAPDSAMGTLLPDASAVIYVRDGALYAVPLLRVDRAAFLAARREAQKAVTLSNGKQLGLAAMMYAQDYDETFPPAENPMETLLPYIKNSSVFNNPVTGQYGFVYALNGNTLASFQTPAETVLGYVGGPGGRAVIYVDGHVKWEDDPR